jgi:WD40 repeat protein
MTGRNAFVKLDKIKKATLIMINYTRKLKFIAIMVLILMITISCFQKVNKSELREIFSINIGFNEADIGAHTSSSLANTETFKVSYKNGFFYFSDAANDKLLKISEKGEPVLFIYNPDSNPFIKPTGTSDESGPGQQSFIKHYRDYPIYNPGLITADNKKNIYCINRHPDYKMTNDDGTIVDQMIIKFSSKGEVLHILGKKGVDSIPFGYISSITCDELDRLLIFEIAKDGINIYLFSEDGDLLVTRTLTSKLVPLTKFESENLVDIIDIIPGYKKNEIYITSQFIRETVSNMNITNYETLYEKIMLYSIEAGKVTRLQLKVQPTEKDLSAYPRDVVQQLYGDVRKVAMPIETLVGVDTNGIMYLTQQALPLTRLLEHTGFLYRYDSNGKLLDKSEFQFPMESSFISDLHFSPDGRIFAYYIERGVIHFVTLE